MSDFIPKPSQAKVAGLGPKAQKLAALREKAAQASAGAKPVAGAAALKGKSTLAGNKKTSFQRKAV